MKNESMEDKKVHMKEKFTKVHNDIQNAIEEYITQGYLQTLATLLVYLDEDKVENVLEQLPVPVWKEVSERFKKLSFENRDNCYKKFNPIVRSEVLYVLQKSGYSEKSLCEAVTSGLDEDELKLLTSETGKLSETDPVITMSLENHLFEFENLLKLEGRAIQKILRDVDQQTLATALKGANPELQEKIFTNMSKQAVELLKEDMEFMGPVLRKQIYAAREEIVKIVYRLEANGDIVIVRNPEDFVIS